MVADNYTIKVCLDEDEPVAATAEFRLWWITTQLAGNLELRRTAEGLEFTGTYLDLQRAGIDFTLSLPNQKITIRLDPCLLD